jgi:Fe-S-cluster containining protein
MSEKTSRLTRKLLPIYQEIEPWVEDTRAQSTCTKGCAHCCRMFSVITLAEGIAIAEYVQKTPALIQRFAGIKAVMLAQLKVIQGIGKVRREEQKSQYFAHDGAPCAFLTNKNECSIYLVRPGVCRTYFVTSAPERCSPAHPGATVAFFDATKPLVYLNERIVAETLYDVPLWMGPLQSAVLVGFEFLQRDAKAFRAWLRNGGAKRYETENSEAL